MRVVSLLPSATEILFELRAGHLLVGRSHECDWPPQAAAVPVVTSTALDHAASPLEIDRAVRRAMADHQPLYHLDHARLAALAPDLVLTQDLCHVCSLDLAGVTAACNQLEHVPRVLSLNPTTLEGMLDDVLTLADAVSLSAAGVEAVTRLRGRMYQAQEYVNQFTSVASCVVLEWTDPLFVAGHWTPQIVERAGAWHPLNPTVPVANAGAAAGPIGLTQRTAGKSVTVPAAVLAASRPEVIVIAPCGRTLAQAREDARALTRQPWWPTLPAVQSNRVAIVDGNQYFSRPGPRLVDALEWLAAYINHRPDAMPPNFAWQPLD